AGQFRGAPVNLPSLQILSRFGATGFVIQDRGQPRRLQSTDVPQEYWRALPPYLLALDLGREAMMLAEKYAPVDSVDAEEAKRKASLIKEWLKPINEQYERSI